MQVFQRQMSKEGLQAVVNGNDAAGGGWSSEMLRDLFTLRQDTASDTYDSRCRTDDDDSMEAEDGTAQVLAPPEHKLQVSRQFHADSLYGLCTGRCCLFHLVVIIALSCLALIQLLDLHFHSLLLILHSQPLPVNSMAQPACDSHMFQLMTLNLVVIQ